MSTIYEVATKLTLIDGMSGALAVISRQVLTLEGGIDRLKKQLKNTRTLLAVGGGMALVGGIGLLTGLKAVTEQAKDLTHELTQIKKLGVNPAEYDRYRTAAFSMPQRVPGTTSADALKVLSMSHSMFGVEGSIKILEPLLQFQQVLGNTLGNYEKAAESMKEMIRGAELSGQFVDEKTHKVDPGKVSHFLELGTKVAAATHGMVDPHTWLMMAQQGGPMMSTMSDEGMLTMAMVGQAMKGPRAGTALQALGRQFLGMKMTTPAADELEKLGFFNGEVYTDKAGRVRSRHTGWSDTGKEFVNGLQEDPLKAAGVLMRTLNEHGFKDMKSIIPELYKIMGTDTARRMEHELLRNMPQMFDEKGRIKKGMGLGGSFGLQNSEDYTQVEHNYEKAKIEMLSQIGLPLMQYAIPIMNKLTKAFLDLSTWAQKNPETIQNIAKGFAALGVAMIGGGAAAILAAIGPAGWLTLGIGAMAAAMAANQGSITGYIGSLKEFMQPFKETINYVIASIKWLGEALMSFASGAIGWVARKLGGFLGDSTNSSYGGVPGGGGGGGGFNFNPANVVRGSADPVANAAGMLGASEVGNNADIQQYLRTGGMGMNPAKVAWCAAFVNASLAKAGIAGTGSAAAASFAHWGNPVTGHVQRGDVLAFPHHVGILTGRTNGNMAEMISGNHGNRVGTSWENIKRGWLRRGASFAPPTGGSRTASAMPTVVLEIDGRELGRSASKHIASNHEHSTQSPFFGGRRMFAGPDHQFAAG